MAIEVALLGLNHLNAARTMLECATPFDRAAQVAQEKLFGGAPSGSANAWGAWRGGALCGVAATAGHWLRLIAVAPEHAGCGVGSALLDAAECRARTDGAGQLRTLDQPGNYLAPGIDARNQPTIDWLTRRGYRPIGENHSLVVDLASNPRSGGAQSTTWAAACHARGYAIRRAAWADRAALCELVGLEFRAEWAFEVDIALSSPHQGISQGVHVALAPDGELVAFAAHDGNNRGLGWFGPAGTLPQHRGRGLGAALLLACLQDVRVAGHDRCVVAWIGPRRFYEHVVGIAGERRYVVMSKSL